jgi:murein DD-endopeptidase MepM/ murein hydrolase activator NlpD
MAEMPWVATGAKVNQGDVIGPIGSSGASTGPHTHFMVKLNGSTIDPTSVLS